VDQIFAKGGVIEALQKAKEQKIIRFAGVTGHADPDVLMQCIERYPFDQILMSLNTADKHHKSFAERLLPIAVEKQMGIIGMKIPARGRILASWKPKAADAGGFEGPATQPGVLWMKEAIYFTLSYPDSTVITLVAIRCSNWKKTFNTPGHSHRSATIKWPSSKRRPSPLPGSPYSSATGAESSSAKTRVCVPQTMEVQQCELDMLECERVAPHRKRIPGGTQWHTGICESLCGNWRRQAN